MAVKFNNSYTAEQIAQLVQGEVIGNKLVQIDSVAGIKQAKSNCLSFYHSSGADLVQSEAGVVLLRSQNYSSAASFSAIVVANPRLAFARLLAELMPDAIQLTVGSNFVVGDNCKIAADVEIGDNCVIGANCVLGSGVKIAAGSVIESNVEIGNNTKIAARVVVHSGSIIGANCILHAGCVIGKSGFGFEADELGQWVKVPQIGKVILEDNVEVGVNSAIDRGALGDTIIKTGVKCDNLVQIGHNTIIGEHTLICGCVGISGSVKIGKRCILAGGAMVGDHVSIADNVIIAGAGAVRQDIKVAGRYAGDPARPINTWLRDCVNIANLMQFKLRLKQLEKAK